MIDLYGMASPNVEKILIMLEEARLDYRLHRVDVFAGEQFAPDFLRLNPDSKVPVIIDDTGRDGHRFTIFESGVILVYLAEKSGRLMPTDLVTRFVTLQWLMLQVSGNSRDLCTNVREIGCRPADAFLEELTLAQPSLRVTPDGGLRRSETATCPSAKHARRGRRCEQAAIRLRATPVRARGV